MYEKFFWILLFDFGDFKNTLIYYKVVQLKNAKKCLDSSVNENINFIWV